MNARNWIEHFRTNRHAWEEPDWESDSPLAGEKRGRLLAESLAIFQLGESGGGTRLRRFVERTRATSAYGEAVDLFIEEEQYHAEILASAVGYLGGNLKRKHWMNSVFRRIRTLLGLRFNLQVLLTAELIAESYYGLLATRIPDPVIESMGRKIVRDEIFHIRFHEEFFRRNQLGWLPLSSFLWALQFQLIFLAVERLVWIDHGRRLRPFGISEMEYRTRARGACRRFLDRVVYPARSVGAEPRPAAH